MYKHYCTNCFGVILYQYKYTTGLCHHCNQYILLMHTIHEAKAVHNIIQKTSQEWLDHIDDETKKLLYGTAIRGRVVQRKEEKKK